MFLREFLRRSVFGHSLVVLGVVLDTIGFVALLRFSAATTSEVLPWYLSLVALTLAAGGYLTWREEREKRDELERRVRLTARLGSYSANVPNPGPDKVSIRVGVSWEIWTSEELITTDRLALNVIYLYPQPWWKVWPRPRRMAVTGLPGKKVGSVEYRRTVYRASPVEDYDEFEYVAERGESTEPHWLLELVLWTGAPHHRYSVPVAFPSIEELHARGTNPPL